MKRKNLKTILPALLVCTALTMFTACGQGQGETGVASEAEKQTAEIQSTVTPEATPTAAPTSTPTPAPTTTPAPVITPKAVATEEPAPEVTEEPPAAEIPEEAPAEEPPAEEQPAEEPPAEEQPAEEPAPEASLPAAEAVGIDPGWEFAGYSAISSGTATLYRAQEGRKGIVVGVNAGHGTSGGSSVYTQCHPDGTPKVTGGTTAEGSVQAMAVSSGMTFNDGTAERDVNLQVAMMFKDLLLANGYDVLMIRESEDVQLDNVARAVLCNNLADCHIAIHYDGDGMDYDKGCYYMSVPDGLKGMYPVSEIWSEDDRLGECLISGLSAAGCPIFSSGSMQMDLTQTSYSKVPSVDVELGNSASDHGDESLYARAQGLLYGVNQFFGQ